MTLQIFDMEQGSPEWFAVRAGIPTASEFATVMAKGEGKTRRAYMLKLAGERITSEPMENFTSPAMDRGRAQEGAARDLYAFLTDEPVTRVGFMRDDELAGGVGCSPDSLVGERGLLELKSAAAHVLIDIILKGDFPPAHKAQCQGALWVSGRDWIDIGIFHPRMDLFQRKAGRDETYIATMAGEIERFNEELAQMVDAVRRYGRPSTLRADLSGSLLMAG